MTSVLLHGGIGPDGAPLELRTDPLSGTISAAAPRLDPLPGDETIDCAGLVLLPAPAEPHAHLDKALTAEAVANPAGDLAGAVAAWHAHWPTLTEEDIAARARRAVEELIAHGTTAIRSHVDIGVGVGLTAVRPVLALRDELRAQGLADLQLVALVSNPKTPEEVEPIRRLRAEAMELGVDVVGGVPHLHHDPVACTREAFALAQRLGRPIDLHTDETLDPEALDLAELVRLVAASGFAHGATASHCCSLGVQAPEVQARVARDVAAAGVAIVTLPQTNLFLQARGIATGAPRGLTAVRALLDAGAIVAAGADNVRDPFNGVGRSDALETASLLIVTAHVSPAEAWHAVSNASRQAMGLPAVTLRPGSPAEVLAVRGLSLADAIARGSEHRVVIHAGRCVARTQVASSLLPLTPVPVLS